MLSERELYKNIKHDIQKHELAWLVKIIINEK